MHAGPWRICRLSPWMMLPVIKSTSFTLRSYSTHIRFITFPFVQISVPFSKLFHIHAKLTSELRLKASGRTLFAFLQDAGAGLPPTSNGHSSRNRFTRLELLDNNIVGGCDSIEWTSVPQGRWNWIGLRYILNYPRGPTTGINESESELNCL